MYCPFALVAQDFLERELRKCQQPTPSQIFLPGAGFGLVIYVHSFPYAINAHVHMHLDNTPTESSSGPRMTIHHFSSHAALARYSMDTSRIKKKGN